MSTDHERAYRALSARDPVLARIVTTYGHVPAFEWHDGGRTGSSLFAAMLLHILGQRISAVAAFVIYDRIATVAGRVPAPEDVQAIGVDGLRGFGLSLTKAGYVLALADAQAFGRIDIEHLGDLDDAQVLAHLTSMRGIGLWSAQTFLIHNLSRPDVLPADDLGLRAAIRGLWDLDRMPTPGEVRTRGQGWAPYRSYAAALLWRSLRPPGEPSDQKERALSKVGPPTWLTTT
jgi:3-methyladenine DNA glycosylase/8-oxoguanine DNA glycosylase